MALPVHNNDCFSVCSQSDNPQWSEDTAALDILIVILSACLLSCLDLKSQQLLISQFIFCYRISGVESLVLFQPAVFLQWQA
jgi:hypothetical protein